MITFDTLAQRVDALMPSAQARLESFVRIPSISSLPNHRGDMQRSAEAVCAAFEARGLHAHVEEFTASDGSTSRPAILASRPAAEGKPTVLLYAHHDVQPVSADGWLTEPFEPTQKGGRLYGRGAADDKVGVCLHLAALEALGEDSGVGIKVFIEGEEEIGSPTFRPFLEAHRGELAADVIIVADSSNWKSGVPSLTVSLRGVVTAQVRLAVLDHAVHSGEFGGPVIDAVTAMCRLIATLHDEAGDVAVEGLHGYEGTGPEYAEDDFRGDSGILPGVHLAGTGSLTSRLWTKPAIDVIAMDVTDTEHASNTLIPSCAATISLRTAPGQDAAQAAEALKAHLESHVPFGAHIEVDIDDAGPAFQGNTTTPAATEMRRALEEAYGHEVVDIGVGGSIPFISDLKELFPQAEVLVTGVSDPDARLHSANESLYLADWRNGILAEALVLARLGQ